MSRKSPYLIVWTLSGEVKEGQPVGKEMQKQYDSSFSRGMKLLWEYKRKSIKLLLTKHVVYNRPCTGYLSYTLVLIFTVTA